MRPLIIGPDEVAAIKKVVAYAMEPDHYYRPGISTTLPGDDPEYIVRVPIDFRCVFTITKHQGNLFRHLTVSVPDPKRRPSPEGCIMLAKEFGFIASDEDFNLIARMEKDGWMVSGGHEGEGCIELIQPLDRQPATASN